MVSSGGRQVNRSEAFICGPALSELGVALDLSKVSELVVAPSAAGLIPNSTTAEPREAGCFCIALTAVGTLQDTHRGDRGLGDKDSLAEAMVERAMVLSGEAAERVLREDSSETTSFVHKLQTGSFFRRSSSGSDMKRRPSHLDGSPDLCGLEELSAYVPKFVWQRCLDHAGFETIAENRRVAILFIISGFQVTDAIRNAGSLWPPLVVLSCACLTSAAAAVAAELRLGSDGSAGPSSRPGEGDRCGGGRVQRHHPPGEDELMTTSAASVTGLRSLLPFCSSASLTSVYADVIASDHYGREGTGRHLCLRSARLQAQQPASSVRESCSFSHRAAHSFWGPVLSRSGRGGLLLWTGWRPTATL